MSQRKGLFVYGSLAEGMVHFGKIAEYMVASEPATVRAHMYRLQVGYPVLVAPGEHNVHGSLVTLAGPASFWAFLDEFHGFSPMDPDASLFCRTSITAQGVVSGAAAAEVYALNPKKLPKTAVLIDNGDWRASMVKLPALTQKLSDRQISYIKRLGSSSGREIVPIDLGLYRELMNLEIIVDKGRRLALSRLGQEVYRFLA